MSLSIGEVRFFVDIHNNKMLIQGEIPLAFNTFELIGKFIETLSKLNKELPITITFDMKKVPFIFIMYMNKIQRTLLQEELELNLTVVTKDRDLLEFLEGFKDSTEEMHKNGMNPFQDILSTMGAGNNSLDEIKISDNLKEKMPEEFQEKVNELNEKDFEEAYSRFNKEDKEDKEDLDIQGTQDIQDLNIEELNKIKFIYIK